MAAKEEKSHFTFSMLLLLLLLALGITNSGLDRIHSHARGGATAATTKKCVDNVKQKKVRAAGLSIAMTFF